MPEQSALRSFGPGRSVKMSPGVLRNKIFGRGLIMGVDPMATSRTVGQFQDRPTTSQPWSLSTFFFSAEGWK